MKTMGIFDELLSKGYKVKAKCANCGMTGFKAVPKGRTAKEFFETHDGQCNNCGLNKLTEVTK